MRLTYQKNSIFSIPIAATPAAEPIMSNEPPVPAQYAMTTFMQRLVCGVTPLPTEELVNQEVRIYPNPSNENMTLEMLKNTEGEKFNLSIFDALGRQVFSLKNQSQNQLILNKKDIGTGLFFVRLDFSNAAKPILKKVVFE